MFSFPPKCHRIQFTHLCFADDLLIFCKGIWSILSIFYQLLELQLNAEKSENFVVGVSQEELNLIQSSIWFQNWVVASEISRYSSSYKETFGEGLLAFVGEKV